MVDKKPDNRPSVKEILGTDFFKNNISKYLSYTILNGSGGAEVLSPTSQQQMNHDHMDAEEIEDQLEKVRNRQRQEEVNKEREEKEREVRFST